MNGLVIFQRNGFQRNVFICFTCCSALYSSFCIGQWSVGSISRNVDEHPSPCAQNYVYTPPPMSPGRATPQKSSCLDVSPVGAMKSFAEANTDGSDKVTYHNYHVMYGPALAPYLQKPVRLLEIGVENGKSLKLWENLFPNHEFIAGIGYGAGTAVHDTFKRDLTDKHVLYTGSQVDSDFLDKILEDLGGKKFDVIIDDGSHIPWHQIFTLEYMFDTFLKDGGVYIIEDIETSYWDNPGASLYGYPVAEAGIGKHGNIVEKLKGVADTMNRGMLLDPSFSILHGNVDHLMSHITFSQNCIIIHKKYPEAWKQAEHNTVHNYQFPSFMEPTRRDYRLYKSIANWDISGMVRI
jgi:hypothetical protein